MPGVNPRGARGTVQIESVKVVQHGDDDVTGAVDLTAEVTPPTNQGRCGSCWAITTSQCLRDRINRARRKRGLAEIPELSHQFLTDCSNHCITFRGRRGCSLQCHGGFLVTGFQFLHEVGTPREQYHPNRHARQAGIDHIDHRETTVAECPRIVEPDEPLYKCQGYYNVHLYTRTFGITNARTRPDPMSPAELRRNAANIAAEIRKHGSVAVCYNLFSDFRAFWKHPNSKNMVYRIGWQLPRAVRDAINPVGDIRWSRTSPKHGIYFKTGHSISIVGYGEQHVPGEPAPVPYWICRNSWGRPSNTFNGGFFKIWRGINASAIEADVGAPEVAEGPAAAMALPPSSSPALDPSGAPPLHPSAHPALAAPPSQWWMLAVVLVLLVLLVTLTLRRK